MRTQSISTNVTAPNYKKTNAGKIIGTGLGTAAGVAKVAKGTKPLRAYINAKFDKIVVDHPNIHNNFTDVFKSCIKTKENGKVGLWVASNAKEVAKTTKALAKIAAPYVAIGLAAGILIDAAVNGIKKAKSKKIAKVANNFSPNLVETIKNAPSLEYAKFMKDDFVKCF